MLDRKRSLVYLTREPGEVCDFLGIDKTRLGLDDEGRIWGGDGTGGRGFGSMEEI